MKAMKAMKAMKVALIGAGLAGMKTASLLAGAGHEVTVFEKSRGLGGRLANRRVAWGCLDIGAQYFTVSDSGFQQEVDRWQQAGAVQVWNFIPYVVQNDELVASPDNTIRYTGMPRMNQLAYCLSDNLSIRFRCVISGVEKKREGWQLCTSEGGVFSGFDWLIVSSPAEQSRELLANCSDLMADVPETVHQPCWALGLATRGKVEADIQGIFGDETVRWASRLSSRPGVDIDPEIDDTWMLHFSPQWSEQQGKEAILDIGQVGVEWLQKILGTDLEVTAEYRHFWRYANIQPLTFDKTYWVDDKQQLVVIGAWCSGGRVEGAWLSAVNMVGDLWN